MKNGFLRLTTLIISVSLTFSVLAQKSNTGSSSKSSTSSSSSGTKPATTKSKSTKKSSKNPKAKPSKPQSPFPGQYPESSERYLTEKDIEHLTPWGMNIMLNEIYARQGYIFKDAELKKHFAGETWYKGKQATFSKLKLTSIEKENVTFLKAHQNKAKI